MWGCHHNSPTHLLQWWSFVLILQIRVIPRSCQYQLLLTHSPYSFSIFFTPFLSFSLLDRFQTSLNYNFILSTTLSCQLNICRHTSRLCLSYLLFFGRSSWEHEGIVLAFFFCFQINICRHTGGSCLPFFYDWFDLLYMTVYSDSYLLANVTGMSDLLQLFGWDDQSQYFIVPVIYRCTFSTRSCRWWSHCLTYIAKSLLCRFPVKIRSCFSSVPREWWIL